MLPSTRMSPRAVGRDDTATVPAGRVAEPVGALVGAGPMAAGMVTPPEVPDADPFDPPDPLDPQAARAAVASAIQATRTGLRQADRGVEGGIRARLGRGPSVADAASGRRATGANVSAMAPRSNRQVVALVPSDDIDDDDMRAADGRVPGRRGRATRQRLLDQTAEMLKSSNYRDLKVVDIARGAGTSPATFYQYFPEVESAILVLAEDMAHEGASLPAIVRDGNWKGRAGYPTAETLVDGFFDFWESHRSVMRVVDLATEEGDQRFRNIRTRLLNEVVVALAEVITRQGDRHPRDLDPMATAGVLVAMLATVAGHRYGFEFWGIRTGDMRRSMARIVHTTVTGQKPPPGA